MTRRSPEVVDGALGFQHHGSPRDASYVWEALDILADEVRALREDIKTVMQSEQDRGSELYAARDTIARVEALLSSWHKEGEYEDAAEGCAQELEAALRAKP